jgi:predicted nucleotidyltransferase
MGYFTEQQKELLKQELVECLRPEKEIQRIVIFGSFLRSPELRDIDVAIFQNSGESYLPLALRYRKKNRQIAHKIPLDIIPLKSGAVGEFFLDEIAHGEVIYER